MLAGARLGRDVLDLRRLAGPSMSWSLARAVIDAAADGTAMLEQFQLSTSQEPVVATTVDLLTTGVNVPSVRNIVFMKPVGSPTVFKQIIGRGSRIDETTGKEFFRIVDYTGATRLFDDWDIPPSGDAGQIPDHGVGVLAGRVVVHGTTEGIEDASLSVSAGMKALAEAKTSQTGTFIIGNLPEATLNIYVAARGFVQRRFRVPVSAEGDELLIELREPTTGAEKVEITHSASRRRRPGRARGYEAPRRTTRPDDDEKPAPHSEDDETALWQAGFAHRGAQI